jgi:hypothetical protein
MAAVIPTTIRVPRSAAALPSSKTWSWIQRVRFSV